MRMHVANLLILWPVTEVLYGMVHHLRRLAVRKETAIMC